MKFEEKRDLVEKLCAEGVSNREIANATGFSMKSVQGIVSKYREEMRYGVRDMTYEQRAVFSHLMGRSIFYITNKFHISPSTFESYLRNHALVEEMKARIDKSTSKADDMPKIEKDALDGYSASVRSAYRHLKNSGNELSILAGSFYMNKKKLSGVGELMREAISRGWKKV